MFAVIACMRPSRAKLPGAASFWSRIGILAASTACLASGASAAFAISTAANAQVLASHRAQPASRTHPANRAGAPAQTDAATHAASPARAPAQAGPSSRTGAGSAVAARTITVANLRDSGAGSLRAAIRRANATPGGGATIRFTVHGVIRLASQLPVISRRVITDGTSAPTHVTGGPPVVEINCNRHAGLLFGRGSAGSRLLGVAVDDAIGDGVTLNAGSITLNGNYIGLNLRGREAGNGGVGVYVSPRSSGDQIGLNTSGDSGVIANVISGNGDTGIVFAGSAHDIVVANRIGTNPAGTSAIGNRGNGIWITSRSRDIRVGGTEFVDAATGMANNPTGSKGTVPPVFVVPPLGNLISGNGRNGLRIDAYSTGNVLNGNFIGTTADGDAGIGNARNGVWIDHADDNSLIGCKFVNNPFVYYNVISGNHKDGLRVTSSDDIVVQGNFFGVGANNTAIVRNRLDGIRVAGSSANTQVGGVIPLGNVSAGNGHNGIEVTGRVHGFITFNTFGGLLAFKGAAPNGHDGLLITSTGGHNLARTNVFSGNRGNGIELAGDASGVTIDPDIAGLSTNGRSPLANGGDGLLIDGTAHHNLVGGNLHSVIPQNTFSANAGYGIAIAGRAHDNLVFGAFVGTKIGGLQALGNSRGGVLIAGTAHHNSIGAFLLSKHNLISGNIGNGVTLLARTHGNRVINNYIGLSRIRRSLPNTGRPVLNLGRGNVIRGNRLRRR